MVIFKYKERLFLRVLPAKRLFNSTTIWEVVNRGDIFAVDLETFVFTVIPGKATVEYVTGNVTVG